MIREDPYAGLLLEVQKQALAVQPAGLCIGEVREYNADRVVICTGGLMLSNEDLILNSELIWDAETRLSLSYDGSLGAVTLAVNAAVPAVVDCPMGAITQLSLGELSGHAQGTGTIDVTVRTRRLSVGDKVILQPSADGQVYYVLCKVVAL